MDPTTVRLTERQQEFLDETDRKLGELTRDMLSDLRLNAAASPCVVCGSPIYISTTASSRFTTTRGSTPIGYAIGAPDDMEVDICSECCRHAYDAVNSPKPRQNAPELAYDLDTNLGQAYYEAEQAVLLNLDDSEETLGDRLAKIPANSPYEKHIRAQEVIRWANAQRNTGSISVESDRTELEISDILTAAYTRLQTVEPTIEKYYWPETEADRNNYFNAIIRANGSVPAEELADALVTLPTLYRPPAAHQNARFLINLTIDGEHLRWLPKSKNKDAPEEVPHPIAPSSIIRIPDDIRRAPSYKEVAAERLTEVIEAKRETTD